MIQWGFYGSESPFFFAVVGALQTHPLKGSSAVETVPIPQKGAVDAIAKAITKVAEVAQSDVFKIPQAAKMQGLLV
jgi:hypothetical protein